MSASAVEGSSWDTGRAAVVVGIDGSAASKDALKWAADYAALTGVALRVISAWEWPVSLGVAMALPEGFSPRKDAELIAAQTVTEVLGASPAIAITTQVVEGSPAAALVDASVHAPLLVVGSRGHGGFAGLLLGSTSEHCARHAQCPVVVVRHQKNGDVR